MPTTTCSQRPTTTPTFRRPAARVARTRSPLGLARRIGAKGPVCEASYHYYVIDDLVDEARRQGACRA
eukprot:4658679-Prymnesium_polylepis.1